MKIEVFILGGQRIDQKRMKAWWRERGLRKGVERKFEEEDKEHRHLPLLALLKMGCFRTAVWGVCMSTPLLLLIGCSLSHHLRV